MSGITINGAPLTDGTFYVPRIGAWSIDARLFSETPIAGKVTVVCDGVTFVGTVARGDIFNNVATLRIAPGAAGLSKTATPKSYQRTAGVVVLRDLLDAAGEALDPTADMTALGRAIPSWSVALMPIGRAIAYLMDRLGLAWRMLPNGKLWAGTEAWPKTAVADTDVQVMGRDDALGEFQLGLISPALLPGTTYAGRKIGNVETTVTAGAVRAKALVEDAAGGGRLLAALNAIVANATADLTYAGCIWCKVVAQAGDSIDVIPEDVRYPPISGVPLTVGVAGAKLTVSAGARVLIGWSAKDPRFPYVHGWDQSENTIKVVLDALRIEPPRPRRALSRRMACSRAWPSIHSPARLTSRWATRAPTCSRGRRDPMPMSADVLGPMIKHAIDAVENKADRDAVFRAMAGAIIAHINTAAQISGPAAGLTSAPGGGPVTGVLVVPPGSIL